MRVGDRTRFRFELPVMAPSSDGVVSPAVAAELGRLGGLGVLHLEGLWTRYADPNPSSEEIATLPARQGHPPDAGATPTRAARSHRAADRRAGRRGATSPWPARRPATLGLAPHILRAEPDLLVIQGTVVSAEHVSRSRSR